MNIQLETSRLILRDLLPSDTAGMYELDSDPLVHTYLGNNPIQTMEQASEVIELVRKQYQDLGVGRLAVVEKSSGNFVGWSGLKLVKEEVLGMVDFYDLGYRLVRRFWGMGYATESAVASLDLGFGQMGLAEIFAEADVLNLASNRVLQKVGMQFQTEFMHYGRPHNVYRISREEWEALSQDS